MHLAVNAFGDFSSKCQEYVDLPNSERTDISDRADSG